MLRPIIDTPEARTKAIEQSIRYLMFDVNRGRDVNWYCPLDCRFHRAVSTKGGLLRVAGAHLKLEHRIRLQIIAERPVAEAL